MMLLSDQFEVVAVCPLNVTVPADAPKLLPEIVTAVPIEPLTGDRLAMLGARTVNAIPLLCNPLVVTTTLPLLAPFGTRTTMLVFDQLEIEAGCPLKVTVPVVLVKLFPVMVMEAPGSPLAGFNEVIEGGTVTVNKIPLLDTLPAAVTTTLPVVAPVGTLVVIVPEDQVIMVAGVPLKVTPPLP